MFFNRAHNRSDFGVFSYFASIPLGGDSAVGGESRPRAEIRAEERNINRSREISIVAEKC